MTFLHQIVQLWSSVCLYTYRVSKKKQVTEYVQMTFTSVLTVLRGLRKLFSASCSIVNARLEMITCLSIICFGCKSLLFLFLSSFFLQLRRSRNICFDCKRTNHVLRFLPQDLRGKTYVVRRLQRGEAGKNLREVAFHFLPTIVGRNCKGGE